MALPTRKHTRSRRDKRRAHWKLSRPTMTKCLQCARWIAPHRVCLHCGYYRGRQVVVIRPKKERGASAA